MCVCVYWGEAGRGAGRWAGVGSFELCVYVVYDKIDIFLDF